MIVFYNIDTPPKTAVLNFSVFKASWLLIPISLLVNVIPFIMFTFTSVIVGAVHFPSADQNVWFSLLAVKYLRSNMERRYFSVFAILRDISNTYQHLRLRTVHLNRPISLVRQFQFHSLDSFLGTIFDDIFFMLNKI